MQKPKLTQAKAARIINEHSLEEKRKRINDVLDTCEKQLQDLGCKFMLAALCRDKRDTEGGKVLVNLEANGSDMAIIIQHAFPSNKDLAYIGIWVGNEIMRRNKEANITFRDKKKRVSKDKVVKPGPAPKPPKPPGPRLVKEGVQPAPPPKPLQLTEEQENSKCPNCAANWNKKGWQPNLGLCYACGHNVAKT